MLDNHIVAIILPDIRAASYCTPEPYSMLCVNYISTKLRKNELLIHAITLVHFKIIFFSRRSQPKEVQTTIPFI